MTCLGLHERAQKASLPAAGSRRCPPTGGTAGTGTSGAEHGRAIILGRRFDSLQQRRRSYRDKKDFRTANHWPAGSLPAQ
jgi:hypothetical protein